MLFIYMSLHASVAYMDTFGEVAGKQTFKEKSETLNSFFQEWWEQITLKPMKISINKYIFNAALMGFLVWLLGTAYYFTTRRRFIHGKEFGTARWATPQDISDLYAEHIKADEIFRLKKAKYLPGRIILKYGDFQRIKKMFSKDKSLIYKKYKKKIIPHEDLKKSLLLIHNEKVKRLLEVRHTRYKMTSKQFIDKLKKIETRYADADMLLTQTERISLYNWKLNNNILIVGGSGSGKTRGFVIPNVLQAHSSFVITDPKGEILEKTGYYLEKVKKFNIRVLNLDSKWLSDGYNPFAYIHMDRPGYEERVFSLIETIIVNTDGGEKKSGSDPFWDKAERLFLQAVFFFTVCGFREEERNMNTVTELIRMLKIEEDRDNMDSDLDIFAELLKEQLPEGSNNIGYQQYMEFREKASGKTAKSIVISAVARLAAFKVAEVRRIFSYDNMHLDRLGEEKTVIFIVVPPTDSTYNFIAGMLFTQMFQELQYCALEVHKHDGQRLPVPCRFILDEFANTCTIPNFIKILAYARSLGIGIVTILQSLEQIKNLYKNEWGVIIDNSNILLYLGSITHEETLKYISTLLGKATFDKRTSGRTRGRNGSSSHNFDVVGRELMTESEIRQMPKEDCILIVAGRPPFYSKKYAYEKHPYYRYTSDGGAESYEFKPYIPEIITHGEEKRKSIVERELSDEYQELGKKSSPHEFVTDKHSIVEYLQKTAKHCSLMDTGMDTGEILDDDEKMILEEILFSETESGRKEEQPIISVVSPEIKDVLKKVEVEDGIKIINDKTLVIEELEKFVKAASRDKDSIFFMDTAVDDGEPDIEITEEDADEIMKLLEEANEVTDVILDSNNPAVAAMLDDIINII